MSPWGLKMDLEIGCEDQAPFQDAPCICNLADNGNGLCMLGIITPLPPALSPLCHCYRVRGKKTQRFDCGCVMLVTPEDAY